MYASKHVSIMYEGIYVYVCSICMFIGLCM